MAIIPVALTIAGSDSGGGAGIQADLKTFQSLGVYGTTAITCITAQNPDSVLAVEPLSPGMVESQIQAVKNYFPLSALKTGMLFSAEIIQAVANALAGFEGKYILDPVMVATSGARLLKEDAISSLKEKLVPLSALVTPNLDEMAILLDGYAIADSEGMKKAAYVFYEKYSVPVLLKGGHFVQEKEAVDLYFDGSELREFRSDFVQGVNTHGTGCTLSAAIVAYLAQGHGMEESIRLGKGYIQNAIAGFVSTGKANLLNHKIQ